MSVAQFLQHVRDGDLTAVKHAVECTPSVLHGCTAEEQRNALHVAAEAGAVNVLRFLLQQQVDFTAPDVAGEVPLMLAARQVGV